MPEESVSMTTVEQQLKMISDINIGPTHVSRHICMQIFPHTYLQTCKLACTHMNKDKAPGVYQLLCCYDQLPDKWKLFSVWEETQSIMARKTRQLDHKRPDRKLDLAVKPQQHPTTTTNTTTSHFIQRGSTTFPKSTTHWGPCVQTREPGGHISHTTTMRGRVECIFVAYLKIPFIIDVEVEGGKQKQKKGTQIEEEDRKRRGRRLHLHMMFLWLPANPPPQYRIPSKAQLPPPGLLQIFLSLQHPVASTYHSATSWSAGSGRNDYLP